MKKIILIAMLLLPVASFAQNPAFPIPDAIKANVSFWESIYSKYSTDQLVVHDINDISRIYEVASIGEYSNRKERESLKKALQKRLEEKYGPYARIQSGQKDKFLEGLRRAKGYQDDMKKIFISYGLPSELTNLPHIESSFDKTAYSKVGAAGIWQFTRSTGKLFMKVNRRIDERRDPIKSTHAAAKLLKGNYEALGSWPLALTAYNHGREGMRRAVIATGTTDIGTIIEKYDGKGFGFASKNFYSEFLAALNIAENPENFFTKEELEKNDVSEETLKKEHIKIPVKKSRTFGKGITTYRVKKGDTLHEIALNFNIPLEVLKTRNNFKGKSRIKPGQVIKIN